MHRRPRITVVGKLRTLMGLALLGALLLPAGALSAGKASRVLAVFDVPGTYSWVVPSGVKTVTFDVFGAQGGGVRDVGFGGLGGETKATFAVVPGTVFQIFVGGRGGTADFEANQWGIGGFNGGGESGSFDAQGGGGGGASDVRIGGSGIAPSSTTGPYFRIVVGGGGGGGSALQFAGPGGLDGGRGGGFSGVAGQGTELGGGVDMLGGAPGSQSETELFGVGGTGCGGGGGGGWYGGKAGTSTLLYCDHAGGGGGGGSGWYSGLALSGSFPAGARAGDGLVIISTP